MDYVFRRNVLDKTLSAQLKSAKTVLQSHKKTIIKFLEIEMGLQVGNLPEVIFQTQEDNLSAILENDFPDFDFNEYFSIYDVGPKVNCLEYDNFEFIELKNKMLWLINEKKTHFDIIINKIKDRLLSKNKRIGNIFGSYSYNVGFDNKSKADHIKINLLSCLFFAQSRNINPNDLILSTYVHELAHFYSHVGTDKDKLYWNRFHEVEDNVTEGIAQYFAYQYFKKNDRIESFDQIENLKDELGNFYFDEVYHEFRKYLSFSKEQMYFAFIKFRRNEYTRASDFLELLEMARKELPNF